MQRAIILLGFGMWSGLSAPGWGQVAPRVPTGSEFGYAGSEACLQCHANRSEQFKHTRMGRAFFTAPRTDLEARGCEACHGPAQNHVDYRRARAEGRTPTATAAADVPGGGNRGATGADAAALVDRVVKFGKHSGYSNAEQNAQCLQCHEKGMRLFWRGSVHESRGVTCVTCHQMMGPSSPGLAVRFREPLSLNRQFTKATQMEVCFQCHAMRRAQMMRSSHMPFREGMVTCANCHNPHGSPNPKLLVEPTVNDTCYKCHAERRGPFLWEHPPVMENCANCHDPHGSSNPQLLKVRTPRLCQRCHIESRHPTTPQLASTRFVFNRACTNCHSQIHGSNHPSGVRFHR
jgi:DmsE family decaheme c-type cytochrome